MLEGFFLVGGGGGGGEETWTPRKKATVKRVQCFYIFMVCLSPRVATAAADTVDDNGGG